MGLAIWLFAVFCAVIVLRIAWLGFVHYKRRRSPKDHRHHSHSHSYRSQHDYNGPVFGVWHDARYVDGDSSSTRHGTPSGLDRSGWDRGSVHSSGGWSGGGSDSGGWGSGGGDSGGWGGSDNSSSSSNS